MGTRPYHSVRRAATAQETRQAILRAALELFEDQGYKDTTVAEIASRAGVSLNAIYSGIGPKPALMIALITEVTDDSTAMWEGSGLEQAPTGEQALRAIAAAIRRVLERHGWLLGELYDNAAADPKIAEAHTAGLADYWRRLGALVGRLEELGVLRGELTVERATDVAWFYFGFSPWRDLRSVGWDWQEAEDWLVQQATRALVSDSCPATVHESLHAIG